MLLITLPPAPKLLASMLSYAQATPMSVVTITDRIYAAQAQRYSKVVLPCHVSSFGLGPSHTTIVSAIRLLASTYVAHAGRSATQRADIISGIHEELGDLE